MAFNKTGVSVTPPTPVDIDDFVRTHGLDGVPHEIGDVREDGMIWDGEKWVLKMDELQEAVPRESICSMCRYPQSQQQCGHCSEG